MPACLPACSHARRGCGEFSSFFSPAIVERERGKHLLGKDAIGRAGCSILVVIKVFFLSTKETIRDHCSLE